LVLTAPEALVVTSRLYEQLQARQSDISELESYARGEHKLRFASKEWSKDHQNRYQGFSDNWCGVVASAGPEVTEVLGFRIGDDVDTLDPAEKQLWQDWQTNEGPALSAQGWLTTAVARRSFALVWGDEDGAPVLTWEHPSQVIVEHDVERPRVRRFAVKAWRDEEHEYATLYEPGAVWKWRAPVGVDVARRASEAGLWVPSTAPLAGIGARRWEPREVPGEKWPLPNPLNLVPVVEFPNRPQLSHGAISDISGTASMQDAINLMWAYLMVAADFASLPQRVVMGQAPPKIPILDENGQKVGEQVVPLEDLRNGRLMFLTGKDTKIGEFTAAKSDFFLEVVNTLARHISQQTKTPIFLIHGELGNVNSETMAALNEPRNAKVRESQRHLAGGIREVMRLMALVRGGSDAPAIAAACRTGTVQWQNPATVSEAQRSDAALKDKGLGLPLPVILESRFNMGQTEIDRIMRQVDEEQARQFGDLLRNDPGGDAGAPPEAPGTVPPAEVPPAA
jgi:hypothetical protein